jgi:anti-anti-sigma regulatory factor
MSGYGGHDFTINVTTSPCQAHAVVALAGDLDIDAWPQLDDAIRRLTDTTPGTVTIDVEALGFAGAALPTFLIQIHHAVPSISELKVSRPSLMARWVLAATDMAEIAKIDECSA